MPRRRGRARTRIQQKWKPLDSYPEEFIKSSRYNNKKAKYGRTKEEIYNDYYQNDKSFKQTSSTSTVNNLRNSQRLRQGGYAPFSVNDNNIKHCKRNRSIRRTNAIKAQSHKLIKRNSTRKHKRCIK